MATYINIIQGNQRLTDQNKQQIEANRNRKEELDGQLRVSNDAREGIQIVRAQNVVDPTTGRRQIVWVKQRPAAYRIGGAKVGHFWRIVNNEEVFNTGYVHSGFVSGSALTNSLATVRIGIERTTTLYCGDGSSSIQIVHGQQPQQLLSSSSAYSTIYPVGTSILNGNGDFAEPLILPAGNGLYILVFIASNVYTAIEAPKYDFVTEDRKSDPSLPYYDQSELLTFSKTTQTSFTRRCFLCSNKNIRELTIPSSFGTILDLVHPQTPTEVSSKIYVSTFLNGNPIYIQTTIPTFSHYVPSSTDGSTIAATPGVFYTATQVLEDASNAFQAAAWSSALGSGVKPVTSTLRWLIEDTGSGAYTPTVWNTQTVRQLFNSSQRFQYGIWRVPGETPTSNNGIYNPASYTPDSVGALNMASGRPSLSPAASVASPGSAGIDELYAVWDWGDPAYCRAMCKSLGFTDSDLTP